MKTDGDVSSLDKIEKTVGMMVGTVERVGQPLADVSTARKQSKVGKKKVEFLKKSVSS